MSTTGSGVGGSIGGPQIPLQTELEATAWTSVNKQALGIVKDSIEQAFIQMTPRYSVGFLGGFGYRTTAQNPLLDHPLESVRRSELTPQTKDDYWVAAYENLVNQLPPDLLARFKWEASKPFEERDPAFTSADNLLRTAAKILTQAEQLAQPAPVGSLEDQRTALNLLLPFAALKGAIVNGQEIISSAQNFLAGQGANYRYFDDFNNLIKRLQAPMNIMEGINNSLNTVVDGQLSPEGRAAAGKAADRLANLREHLEKISLGNDLQMLLTTIKSMETVMTALSLPITSSAPLFIAANFASLGFFTSETSGGMLGSSFEALLDNINTGLIANLMPSNNKGGNELLSLVLALSLTTLAGLGKITYDSGLGLSPKLDPKELNSARAFTFEIALQLAVSSGVIGTFYQEIIAVSGGDEKAQRLGSSVLTQLALLVIILAGSAEGNSDPAKLIEGVAKYLNQGILSASEVEKNAETEKTAAAAIAIQLATLALESQDYEGFLDAFNNILESIGTSLDALKNETEQVNNNTGNITKVIGMGNPDENITRIVTVI